SSSTGPSCFGAGARGAAAGVAAGDAVGCGAAEAGAAAGLSRSGVGDGLASGGAVPPPPPPPPTAAGSGAGCRGGVYLIRTAVGEGAGTPVRLASSSRSVLKNLGANRRYPAAARRKKRIPI